MIDKCSMHMIKIDNVFQQIFIFIFALSIIVVLSLILR
jgi:hypothetical protein